MEYKAFSHMEYTQQQTVKSTSSTTSYTVILIMLHLEVLQKHALKIVFFTFPDDKLINKQQMYLKKK